MVLLLLCLTSLHANLPATGQSGRTVGSVYGKAITSADIGLDAPIDPAVQFDARDTARWEVMGRISRTFGSPVVERFVSEKKIDATAGEIEAFKENSRKRHAKQVREKETQLAKAKADLASPGLRDEEKAALEKTRALLERILPVLRESAREGPPEDLARHFIVAWKTERELHRAYSGRVIFQQAGPEALDARRRLFEQAEKNGDLRFDDAGVRHLFYYYVNMKHREIDQKAIERAWFLGDE